MERRGPVQERRKGKESSLPEERRSKSRRKARKFDGSPPRPRDQIDVSNESEVSYWTEQLGVSAAELKSAVQKAGPSVKDVRAHLGK